jgi:ribosome recycling factor
MVDEVLSEAERKMRKAVDTTAEEFSTVRTGKASTSLLNRVMVDYYGQPTPLNQISSISAPEPSLLIVSPYDKSVLMDVERAILQADLGLNPANDGQVLRLPIPKLTEERRKEMIKMVKTRAEEGRVAVRNVRREGIEDLRAFEKESEITKDDLHHGQEEIQKLTDRFVHEIDEMLKTKEKELMEV